MTNIPKETGRKYKQFDIYGWFMCILGLILMCKFGGVGWIFGTEKNWWLVATVFLCFWEYAIRVAYGRVYKFVYYDTIIHPLYVISTNGDTFYVNAESEDDLEHYLTIHYPNMEYDIVETHTETYIKTDKFL